MLRRGLRFRGRGGILGLEIRFSKVHDEEENRYWRFFERLTFYLVVRGMR